MARSTRATAAKRQRERALVQRRKDKEARRVESRDRAASAPPVPEGVDPDIADIRPGPQPLADWQIEPSEEPKE